MKKNKSSKDYKESKSHTVSLNTHAVIGLKNNFIKKRPSFFIGMGSIFNVFENYFEYTPSKNAQKTDTKSLASNWKKVGGYKKTS